MKDLLLLRHAKSSWEDSELSDFERALNARGKRDATRIGKLILEEGLTPHCIISSSAVRARSTADIVSDKCQYKGKFCLDVPYMELGHRNTLMLYKV
jgi:phosphohistidine phosphatase